jgi:integrase
LTRKYTRNLTTPKSEWETQTGIDVAAALPRTASAAVRAPAPTAKLLAPRSRENVEYVLERFYKFQEDIDPGTRNWPARARIARKQVEPFFQSLMIDELEPSSIVTYLERLAQAAARLDPGGNFRWLQLLIKEARKGKLPPKPAPLSQDELFAAGCAAMDAAVSSLAQKRRRRGTPDEALLYRNGLMLALAADFPLRAEDAVALKTGDFTRLESGDFVEMKPVSIYRVSCRVRKNRGLETITRRLSPALTTRIDFYNNEIRPKFRGSETIDHFFLDVHGSELKYIGYYNAFWRCCVRFGGKRMSPHKARTSVATSAADSGASPKAIAALLQERSLETAVIHYIASRKWIAVTEDDFDL